MADTGDVVRVDLGEGRPRIGLVMSNVDYHRLSGRVLVAPQLSGPVDAHPVPWHIVAEDRMVAIDQVRSVPEERVLAGIGAAPFQTVMRARRALLAIT